MYGGCSQDGQVLCWMTSAGIVQYFNMFGSGKTAYRLIAEQNVLGIAVGDMKYHCLRMMVRLELHELV